MFITSLAAATLLLVHRAATIRTFHAVPVGKPDVSASGVIGHQRLADDCEEVEQTALLESLPNRNLGLSFAQRIPLDVGMGRLIAAGGGAIRVGRHDSIGTGISQIRPAQNNLEPS